MTSVMWRRVLLAGIGATLAAPRATSEGTRRSVACCQSGRGALRRSRKTSTFGSFDSALRNDR